MLFENSIYKNILCTLLLFHYLTQHAQLPWLPELLPKKKKKSRLRICYFVHDSLQIQRKWRKVNHGLDV